MGAEIGVGLIYSDFISGFEVNDGDRIEPGGLRIGDIKVYIADQLKADAIPTVRQDFRIEELKLGDLKNNPNMVYYREKDNGAIYDNFAYAHINNAGRLVIGSIKADSKSNLVQCYYQNGDLWSISLYVDNINDNWMMETLEGTELATLTNLQMALAEFQIVVMSDKTNFVNLEIVDGDTFMSLN